MTQLSEQFPPLLGGVVQKAEAILHPTVHMILDRRQRRNVLSHRSEFSPIVVTRFCCVELPIVGHLGKVFAEAFDTPALSSRSSKCEAGRPLRTWLRPLHSGKHNSVQFQQRCARMRSGEMAVAFHHLKCLVAEELGQVQRRASLHG